MSRVLVTGGAGFIGSHLTEALLARGDRVTVVDDESTGDRANLVRVLSHPQLTYVHGDVTESDVVDRLVVDVDQVYHLAASVGVSRIAATPIDSIRRNIVPTDLLLEALYHQMQSGRQVKMFLASTSEVYGRNPKPVWTEQDDLVLGSTDCARWSYGASKAIDEFLALAWHRHHGLPVVVGRLFNVVGPRQSGAYGMVLPRLIEAAQAGRSPVVYDDGQQVRCFAHVGDVVAALTALMAAPAAVGRVVNVGSDQPVTILELARKVVAAAETQVSIAFMSYAEAYHEGFQDVRRRVPDVSLLRSLIDWRPAYDLDRIVAEAVEW